MTVARSMMVVGATLVFAGLAMTLYGVTGLFAVGGALLVAGALASFSLSPESESGGAECPECSTRNWADRAQCRECGADLR
ncbi:hypothetical protein M0R88_00685 [Halorussus gelatinilyticus]|uniref:Uncharacterized protein n=1 Tax=Halorussus gelatinilyticus TaxID=2937524 RepID=A0A8U0IK81_9EURY|nr:hypothetical protein [Halorussus gelatinilyticus]UPW00634.1 hypothetical protein M0R88_00685 [Halorussus gelatinilyticus]